MSVGGGCGRVEHETRVEMDVASEPIARVQVVVVRLAEVVVMIVVLIVYAQVVA